MAGVRFARWLAKLVFGMAFASVTGDRKLNLTGTGELMIPRLLIYLMVLLVIPLAGISSSAAAATQRATTEEFPAALVALGVDESRILEQAEADLVRGEAWVLRFSFDNLNIFAVGEGPLVLLIDLPHVDISLRLGR